MTIGRRSTLLIALTVTSGLLLVPLMHAAAESGEDARAERTHEVPQRDDAAAAAAFES
jgi:hypothetical protein